MIFPNLMEASRRPKILCVFMMNLWIDYLSSFKVKMTTILTQGDIDYGGGCILLGVFYLDQGGITIKAGYRLGCRNSFIARVKMFLFVFSRSAFNA